MSPPLRIATLLCLGYVSLRAQATLPGTLPLLETGDLAARMVDGIHAWLDRETAAVPARRAVVWRRDTDVSARRARLRKIVGAVDPHADVNAEPVTPAAHLTIVTWPVYERMNAEGLLLRPASRVPVCRAIVMPDAGWRPNQPSQENRLARQYAAQGCLVLIPTPVDRTPTWSGVPRIRMTNQPHREWIYRMAFEAGRHILGYDVDTIFAAGRWLERQAKATPLYLAGHGEGGFAALLAAALEARFRSVHLSGHFGPREELWREPIYRDLWGFLREFGDAELAAMAAPAAVAVEASRGPEVNGPPPETGERRGACPNGRLTTPGAEAIEREMTRARALGAVMRRAPAQEPGPALLGADNESSRKRVFDGWVEHTQRVIRQSPARRAAFWAQADASSPERWRQSTRFYRDHIWNEVIGRMPDPDQPANPRTRPIYDEPKFRGYEVMLDVWRDVFAYGILLVPKNLGAGQRRAVVVCQHGLEGRPSDLADPKKDHPAYHRYAARLAEEGFVVYAPQNPYIGEDRFRRIQRKSHPLKLSLFSFILGQHQRTLEWLGGLPFADPARIGFYGLSYGGKTAVRVPPLLDGYALSICSADFNEWVWKVTSAESRYSYMLTREYDMLEFDFANVVNYAELGMLMAPRPFMVERGHADGVAPDEWVACEFARVRRFYTTQMKMPERARIEFFDGPHTIHGVGTFDFLRRFLRP